MLQTRPVRVPQATCPRPTGACTHDVHSCSPATHKAPSLKTPPNREPLSQQQNLLVCWRRGGGGEAAPARVAAAPACQACRDAGEVGARQKHQPPVAKGGREERAKGAGQRPCVSWVLILPSRQTQRVRWPWCGAAHACRVTQTTAAAAAHNRTPHKMTPLLLRTHRANMRAGVPALLVFVCSRRQRCTHAIPPCSAADCTATISRPTHHTLPLPHRRHHTGVKKEQRGAAGRQVRWGMGQPAGRPLVATDHSPLPHKTGHETKDHNAKRGGRGKRRARGGLPTHSRPGQGGSTW